MATPRAVVTRSAVPVMPAVGDVLPTQPKLMRQLTQSKFLAREPTVPCLECHIALSRVELAAGAEVHFHCRKK